MMWTSKTSITGQSTKHEFKNDNLQLTLCKSKNSDRFSVLARTPLSPNVQAWTFTATDTEHAKQLAFECVESYLRQLQNEIDEIQRGINDARQTP